MRKDMSKVIVERPRLGGKHVRKGRAIQDLDLMTSHEGMRDPYLKGYNYKELNENLAPLLRFLKSRVGQNWDQVWSEISQNIRATSAVQQHVRDHVTDFVETKTRVDEHGEIWCCDGSPRPLTDANWVRFYVDPDTKSLCVNPYYRVWKKRYKLKQQQMQQEILNQERDLPDGTHLRKHKGIWYSVQILPIPPVTKETVYPKIGEPYQRTVGGTAYDVILEQTVGINKNQVYSVTTGSYLYRQPVYCASKRQLNHNELKKYGIEND